MSTRYTIDKCRKCVEILRASTTYPAAIERILLEVDPALNRTALGKAFARHGLSSPSSYVGTLAIPPEPRASGVSAFKEPWGFDEILYAGGVAQPAQQSRSGQHAFRSEKVKADCTGREKLTTIIAVPDIHAPFHDRLAVATCVEAVRQLKPDHLVFLGDVVDSYDISDFPRDPGRKHKYKEEIAEANDVLDMFDQLAVPDVRFCAGNHDYRLDRYIAKRAPELHGMLSIEDELHIEERCWQWVPYGEVTTIGKFHFSHEFGSCGKYAAATALAGTRHCIVFGHTHRAQCEYGGLADGERHVAWSSGWLGDYESLAFSYKRKWQARREWTHGFTWIVLDETGRGCANFIPILDGRCIVDGQIISGRKEAA